jgi:murein DD-endopeptidase MepM/ murein hydrolase activator NlpD
MGRIIVSLVAFLFLFSSTAHAEDASVLLKKYGIKSVLSAGEETKKLDIVEEEYYKVAQVVNTNTMLGLATDVLDVYSQQKMMEMDKEIYSLSDSLHHLENQMGESKESAVDILVTLDSEYRSTQALLEKRISDRAAWASKLETGKSVAVPTEAADQQKYDSLSNQVDKQREKVRLATTYPELGNVSNFTQPLMGHFPITSGFGYRLNPVTKDRISFHRGMDFGAPKNTLVLAAFDGTVEETSHESAGGNYVLINHGSGIKTIYMHLNGFEVNPGDKVKQYEVIARSGNTGTSTTGPHLHFGVYINGQAVDPAVFVPH